MLKLRFGPDVEEHTMWVSRVLCLSLLATHAWMSSTAVAQEVRISHQWAEQTDARDRAARIFAQEAEMRTRGLKFRIYPNSSFNIKPRELLDALQNEKLEMAIFPLVYAAPKVPEFSLAGLPGIVPNSAAAKALKSSEVFTMLQSIGEENGIRILALFWNPGGFLTKSREISEPKSVEGLRMRVSDPLFGLMLKHVGASATMMPSNEIYGAMQSGSLDGVVTTYETILSLKIFEQAKFATVGGPALFMGFSPLIMSLGTWKRLTPEQQAAVEEAAAISDTYYAWAQRDVEQRMLTAVRNAGLSVRRMTSQEYLAWLQVAQQTAWQEYAKISPRAQELVVALVRNILQNVDDPN
jgi:TRAP-type C4-dicarboxylate transport system substrate-binding protein